MRKSTLLFVLTVVLTVAARSQTPTPTPSSVTPLVRRTLTTGDIGTGTGTVAAGNSPRFAHFNAVYDFGTTNANAQIGINAALAAACNAGGGVVDLPPGTFSVSGFVSATNSAITLPQNLVSAVAGGVPRVVRLRGAGRGSLDSTLSPVAGGTFIDATGLTGGTGVHPAVIAGALTQDTSNGAAVVWNNVVFLVENLTILTAPASGLTGVNLSNCLGGGVADARVGTKLQTNGTFGQPTSAESVGIILPQVNNRYDVTCQNNEVFGFYAACMTSEHAQIMGNIFATAKVGLQVEAGFHLFYAAGNKIENCARDVQVDGACTIYLTGTQIEHPAAGNWFSPDSGNSFYDPSAFAHGRFEYSLVLGGVGPVSDDLPANGAYGIIRTNVYSSLVRGNELLVNGSSHLDSVQVGVKGDGSAAVVRVEAGDGTGDAAEIYSIPGQAGFQGFNRNIVNTVPLRIVGGSAVFYTGDISALNETMYLSPLGGVNLAVAGDPEPGLGNLVLSGKVNSGLGYFFSDGSSLSTRAHPTVAGARQLVWVDQNGAPHVLTGSN